MHACLVIGGVSLVYARVSVYEISVTLLSFVLFQMIILVLCVCAFYCVFALSSTLLSSDDGISNHL